MKYRILSVGKIRESFYNSGVEEYIKRLRPYANIEVVDGLEEKISPHAGAREIEKLLDKEGQRILNLIGENEITIVLDVKGRSLSSEELAGHMRKWNESGKGRVNLVIGGAHGLSEQVKRQSDEQISFSRMTFPHQMAVLILTEQIYRGFKIIKGEPYHK
ncbi:MAG TPA: 23S rRNA (pseudouridine(1915)-N(3))-methyltransferase RlmH [Syntrophomonas sp.]|nr:23S rRNA (pseudouridine(1915)-N(3))-methyltransferase RlmH [Syntrophomonas sp.]HCF70721.1 23S rRNA (pseudouridine(1915)-N(3))-methyltransferase RlmH [Syntrophomonas sp.]